MWGVGNLEGMSEEFRDIYHIRPISISHLSWPTLISWKPHLVPQSLHLPHILPCPRQCRDVCLINKDCSFTLAQSDRRWRNLRKEPVQPQTAPVYVDHCGRKRGEYWKSSTMHARYRYLKPVSCLSIARVLTI